MIDLSVLIPARDEEWLDLTIQDVLRNCEANTEVIAVLDGYIPASLTSDPRVTLIYNPIAKGQRAATNQAAKLARGKYLMKLDAHCAMDKGFDRKMLEAFKECEDDVSMVPVLRNLHVFDWVCPLGHRRYQGKDDVCKECNQKMAKEVLWFPKLSPARFTFTFDKTMHFQYWGELAKRPENIAQGYLRETMSIQGSCFMLTREKYFELDISSETDFNSWGQQGVEVACKTWLSGGRVLANLNTWYAHMFRTNQFGGFPYSNPESKIQENREKSRELFERGKWPKAKYSFKWLLNKFNPPDWTSPKGIIYYTDNELDEKIAIPVRNQLIKVAQEERILITTAALKKRLDFGTKNLVFPSLKRGYYAMFKQILGALENSSADVVFFCEHDVLYHPSHFNFIPKDKDTFYYNQNVWYIRSDGFALHYDVNQLSGLCVYRDTAIKHFRERLARIEKEGFTRNMGFEPFTHNRIQWKTTFFVDTWKSSSPNIDIRYGLNSTGMRWRKDQYRNQQLLINWIESSISQISGWLPQDFEFLKLL